MNGTFIHVGIGSHSAAPGHVKEATLVNHRAASLTYLATFDNHFQGVAESRNNIDRVSLGCSRGWKQKNPLQRED